ncbi:hypothetical protein LTR37_002192 [Vermiconidia calcicola]|uniref:Uncharacterized protein n=1 Tax=Vermiconidia calcicola TaxID=1690605 RepID=A0ACC3NWQ4_9PEZI|nr:hypothetical protein LTR37_002192 [Vermiconidia calcicola]
MSLRIRDLGYAPGVLPTGPSNSILDVPGVHISQVTVPTTSGSTARKGLTIISPRPPKDYYKPCHASSFCFNGNGELTGARQMNDWGYTNIPIAFTNSLSLGVVIDGMWDWVMDMQDDMGWGGITRARHYGTPVVGETADWLINSEVRATRLGRDDVKKCFEGLESRDDSAVVHEGQVGGGAGMTCHMFTDGTGTSSRTISSGEDSKDAYTIAALCQSNYGVLSDLVVGGVPIGRLLKKEQEARGKAANDEGSADVHGPAEVAGRTKDGSILILIITDAPLATHQLNRAARHATVGLARVGSYSAGRNFSGDIFIALSTSEHGPEQLENISFGSAASRPTQTYQTEVVKNECMDAYFCATAGVVEEAIMNSMVVGGGDNGTVAMDGTKIDGFPLERVRDLLVQYMVKI